MSDRAPATGAARPGLLRRIFGLRRTDPPVETADDRFVWLGNRIAGVFMSEEEALRLSAVWACVTVIAKSLAACTWDVYSEKPNGDREPRRATMTYRLLNERPNPEMTPFAWREAMLIEALVWGRHVSEIETDLGGRPVALWPVAADRWDLRRDAAGALKCRIRNRARPDVDLDYADVFHLHGPSLDGLQGMNVVTVAARTLAHAAAAERFGQAFYSNGTQMGGVLTSPGSLNAEQLAALKKQIEEKHQGPDKAFRFLMLGGGVDYKQLSVNPDDAQFIETRQFMIEEVCRWFGVPPHKIQHLLRATNNNIEHQGIEFVRDACTPWAERMAQEADWKLLPDWRGINTRLDLDWLSEGDAKSRADEDAILANNGLRTINELRKKRGWNSAGPEADVLRVQMQNVPLGTEPAAPAPSLDTPASPATRDERVEGLTEADERVGNDPVRRAAHALLQAAGRRCLLRQFRQAQDLATRHDDPDAFGLALDALQPAQARYAGDQIERALALVDAPRADPEAVAAIVLPALSEDVDLLRAAFADGSLAAWCDIETRAAAFADALTPLIGRTPTT